MAIPKPKVFWPLIVGAANNKVYFRENGVTERTGTIANGTYFSAKTYFDAVVAAMNAVATGTTLQHSTDGTGVVTISTILGVAWRFSWGSFATNGAYSDMGWFAANTADAISQVAPRPHVNGWYSPTAARSLTPDYNEDKNSVVTVSSTGLLKAFQETSLVRRDVELAWLPPANTLLASDSTGGRQALQAWWLVGRGRFRFWPDATVEGTSGDYFLDLETIAEFNPVRMRQDKELYSFRLRMRKYVG